MSSREGAAFAGSPTGAPIYTPIVSRSLCHNHGKCGAPTFRASRITQRVSRFTYRNQAVLKCVGGGLDAGCEAELAEDIADVNLDGALGDDE